eukprot:1718150-Prymnesium_polylepis.1
MTSPDGDTVVDSHSAHYAAIGVMQGKKAASDRYYRDMVYERARRCIEPQIQEFRAKHNNRCMKCDNSTDIREVDLVNQFKGIVDAFLAQNPEIYDQHVPINNKHLFAGGVSLAKFYSFHYETAELQLLCKPCHRLKTAADRKRPRS